MSMVDSTRQPWVPSSSVERQHFSYRIRVKKMLIHLKTDQHFFELDDC